MSCSDGVEQLPIDIALVHYPVSNKKDEIIGSAVTNMDLHDIARAGRTYGVRNYYVVTPYDDQLQLVGEIIEHWRHGAGSVRNPDRKSAFSIIRVVRDLAELYAAVTQQNGGVKSCIYATSAAEKDRQVSFASAQQKLTAGEPMLVLFGTASGMANEVFEAVDYVLPSVGSGGNYNHLSVRSAVSIVLDRLLGC